MKKVTVGGQTGAGINLLILLVAGSMYATPAGQAGQNQPETPAKSGPATAAPDHASAYYHFVLARRYEELAGLENRSDLVDRAISEYQAALAADPGSLFVRTQLAELYYRISRVGDAIREAEAVLQVNPDEVDAHRLLASIYLHSLGDSEAAAASEATLRKAITQFEAVTRLDPSDTDSLVALGRLYRLTNQNDKAEETLRK